MRSKDFLNIKFGVMASSVGIIASEMFYEVPNEINVMKLLYMSGSLLTILFTDKIYSKTEEYKEIKSLYNEVLDKFVILTKRFNFKDPLKIYFLFYVMYRNGYLSYNNNWQLSNDDAKDFLHLNGVDVLRGYGVCRSISALLDDIYKRLGYDSKILHVAFYDDPLVRLKMPNHVINQVIYDDKNYILDPTNLFLLKPYKDNMLISDELDVEMAIKYKANALGRNLYNAKNNYSKKDLLKTLELPTISFEEFYDEYKNVSDIISKNEDLIENFYLEIEEILNDIYEKSYFENNFNERLFSLKQIEEVVDNASLILKRKGK